VLLMALLCEFTLTQLTPTDMTYIKKTLQASQDEATGLFDKSAEKTYKAAFALKTLGENVNNVPKICREISFEAMNGVTNEILALDELINCKLNMELQKELKDDDFLKLDLNALYKKVSLANKSNAKFNWSAVYEVTKSYLNANDKLFSNTNTDLKSSLASTATGLKLLSLVHANLPEENKKEVQDLLTTIVQTLQKEFQLVRDDIGLFTEDGVASLKLNSEFAEALYSVKSIVDFENFEELLIKILNYLVTFKYDYTGLDNIYYLVKGINVK
jgi:hypothetical protein